MALTINTKIVNDADNYSLDAKQVKGTYVAVETAAERDALPTATIIAGSRCYVSALDKTYIYKNSAWVEESTIDISGKEDKSNKVTSLSSESTDTQYPSAKATYDGLASKLNSDFTNYYNFSGTWTAGTMPSTANWSGIAYGNDRFVAVGADSTKAAWSRDGVTWNEVTLPLSNRWNDVCFGNGLFVVIGETGTNVCVSTDGITWTGTTNGYAAFCSSFGNGYFISAPWGGNKFHRSKDGLNWEEITVPRNAQWQTLKFCDNVWIAACSEQTYGLYSYDGITWTEMTMPAAEDWQCFGYINGAYLCFAHGNSNYAYSTDAINWELKTSSAFSAGNGFFYTATGAGRCVLIEGYYTKSQSYYTTDGINWTNAPFTGSAIWWHVAYGKDKFVAVSKSSLYNYMSASSSSDILNRKVETSQLASVALSGDYSDIRNTPDMTTKENVSNKVTSISSESTDTEYPSAKAVNTELDTINTELDTKLDADFTNLYDFSGEWTAGAFPSSANWSGIAYGNDRFVVVAQGSTSSAWSRDGITWNAVTLPCSNTWNDVCFGNGVFVATGEGNANTCVSADGITWTQGNSIHNLFCCSYGNGYFIGAPWGGSTFYRSKDGINWEAITVPRNAQWQTLKWCDNVWIAACSGQTYGLYSYDGVTWTEMTMPASEDWQCFGYINGAYLCFGHDNSNYAYSTDAINWTLKTSEAFSSGNRFFFSTTGAGKCVLISGYHSHTATYYSEDGINWTHTPFTVSKTWWHVAYGKDKFVATGKGSAVSNYMLTNPQSDILNRKVESSELAQVALSGSYTDLRNQPTIPTVPENIEQTTNKTTTLTSASTDTQYPSAKAVYDYVSSAISNSIMEEY